MMNVPKLENKVIPENLDLEMALKIDKERWDQYSAKERKEAEQKLRETKRLRLF